MEPEVVIYETSPNGNVDAYVEQDDQVVMFYLHGAPDTNFSVRACWVRNLKPAPEVLNVADMRVGKAPMLSRSFCAHPEGAPKFTKSNDLRVVWFPEGDAAALLDKDGVLAVLPAWSGCGNFHGYARDCIGESDLCWEFGIDNALLPRIQQAEDFWNAWDQETSPWPSIQEEVSEALEKSIGLSDKYYAIDGGNWPPKAMLRMPRADAVAFATVGVSIRPQPKVEMHTETPQGLRRIELGMCIASSFTEEVQRKVMGFLGGLANFPWNAYTWLGPYHTVSCGIFEKTWSSPDFTSAILMPQPSGAPSVTLPPVWDDPVNLLWVVPITEDERKFAMDRGGEALAKDLTSAGHGWIHRLRRQVRLK